MLNVSSQSMTAYKRAKPQFHTYRTAEDILWYISSPLVEQDDHTNGVVIGSMAHFLMLCYNRSRLVFSMVTVGMGNQGQQQMKPWHLLNPKTTREWCHPALYRQIINNKTMTLLSFVCELFIMARYTLKEESIE